MKYFSNPISICLFVLISTICSFTSIFSQSIRGFTENNAAEQRVQEEKIKNNNTSENFRIHLQEITKAPHPAGSEESEDVIKYLTKVMTQSGLEVKHDNYDVLLAESGKVKISVDKNGTRILNNKENEFDQDPYSSHPKLTHGWNAYSASGKVTSEIVYVNYGTLEDFELLDSLGINIEGKIALARYGRNFRGFKAKYAEEAGASGLIIYTDPKDSGFKRGAVYPEGKYNDESAIQRGSLLTMSHYGDPLTPFEAALPLDHPESPKRLEISEAELPGIPVAPIGYGEAVHILSEMEGEEVPEGWQGGLDFTYRITGGSDLMVTLEVDQPLKVKRITNVIGKIEGSDFPDEWIIIGCHHDAWTFGSTDPNSGTALMLTLAETFGKMMKEGWQPKRSILFAHWDAEEFGLIGSVEWVEQYMEELQAKAVAYLNADMSVTGPNFRASASPTLRSAIIEAARDVMHPDTNLTLLDYWLRDNERTEPPIGRLGSGSDFLAFINRAGIPSAQLSMSGGVPVYHSAYDNMYFYENFVDSTFKYGPVLASYYGILTSRFANADLLPYDPLRLAAEINRLLEEINVFQGNNLFENSNIPDLVNLLYEQASLYNSRSHTVLNNSSLSNEDLMKINKELIQYERILIVNEGLEFKPWLRNLYISPDPYQGYAAWPLPVYRHAVENDLTLDESHMVKIEMMHIEMIRNFLQSTNQLNEWVRP